MKRLSVLAAGAALLLTTTAVLATPSSGITAVQLARGTSANAYTITHTANRDIMTQTLTLVPGATTGWHSHPGSVVVIVQSGTLSLWDSVDCVLETYTAGQALVVPGGSVLDLARNDGATNLVLVVTYYNVPVGGAQSVAGAAQCTTTAGVPQDVGSSGVTAVTHTRTRLAAALNIAGTAGTDLMIQQLTWLPGSTAGWHSHPGPVTVGIESGSLTFQATDCSRTAYPAGTTLFDAGTTHEASSTTTTLAFATYTNIPAGGAARIDQAAPACAAPASAAPAASAVPDTSSSDGTAGIGGSATFGAALVAFLSIGGLLAIAWRRRTI